MSPVQIDGGNGTADPCHSGTAANVAPAGGRNGPHDGVTVLADAREARRAGQIRMALEDTLSKLDKIGGHAEFGFVRRLVPSYRGEVAAIFDDDAATDRVTSLMALSVELTRLGACMAAYARVL
jgi:hypothetical protein